MDITKTTHFHKRQVKDNKKDINLIKDMEKTYQRKIEKISQAIYLVSNHLKDNEPLKWELRKESIGFLSCIRSMGDSEEGIDLPPDLVVDALATYARDLISLLTLATVSGLMSKNNGVIIIQEIENLLSALHDSLSLNVARPGYVLSHDFFATDPELQQHLTQSFSKGQIGMISDKVSGLFNEKIPFPPKTKNQNLAQSPENIDKSGNKVDPIKDKKDSRQLRILTLLRARSNLSIKDFASVIPDCSEKTIQRELLELVEKGVIKKEGERRWSTYSIA
jgi:hypothetical protein